MTDCFRDFLKSFGHCRLHRCVFFMVMRIVCLSLVYTAKLIAITDCVKRAWLFIR